MEEAFVDSPVGNQDDEDVMVVSYTTSKSRKRTRTILAALEKKRVVLVCGDDVDESEEEVVAKVLRERSKNKLKVNDNRNRINNRRIARNVKDFSTEGMDFYSKEHRARWKFGCARNIRLERFLYEITYNNQTYIDILQDARLLGILTEIGVYWPQLLRKFVCNLSEEIVDPASSMSHKVKLQGHIFSFSPALINKHYGMNNEGIT
ncbi:hypothetical protein LIER_37382 [Lithospermum erythrorhizon]|uniref:Uncharacterized protein n=1 Tax=Lithospermum erythrorhizon TaxID=34254 RepID=A0AAV3PJT3_LITER